MKITQSQLREILFNLPQPRGVGQTLNVKIPRTPDDLNLLYGQVSPELAVKNDYLEFICVSMACEAREWFEWELQI